MNAIYITKNKKEEKFLRKKTKLFNFGEWDRDAIEKLIADMRNAMRKANGIGLSANQIGIPWRVFVAEVPSGKGVKFYAVFNPTIEKKNDETFLFEEGCLSVPGVYGAVERPSKVTLSGKDKRGKSIKIKAWGLLARVFQHEVDHLDGVLFIDKAKKAE